MRSFADASRGPWAGDGTGDLQGLIDHLDYLNTGRPGDASLGVTALWLMPVCPSPSYHGYDVSDYFGVNPQYGNLDLMRRLVREAHRRGIRIIVDLVLNHASSEHPLFRRALADPESADGRLFCFSRQPTQLYGPWGEPVWYPVPPAGRPGGEFYYGVFAPDMPDWNFRDPAVTEHHRRVARFWLNTVGVDGFRLDAVRYFYEDGDRVEDVPETLAWLRGFTAYCHAIKPGAFVVGECAADSGMVSRYLHADATDSLFEFDLATATLESVRLHAPSFLAGELARLQADYGGAAPWSTFLANHDQVRTRTQLGGNWAQTRLAAELEFTEPGVPFIYYGEEIGMAGSKPDPDIRTPMQWSGAANAGFAAASVRPWHAVNADYPRVNVAREQADPRSLLALYRQLIRTNAGSPALRRGQVLDVRLRSAGGILVEARQTDSEVVLVLANLLDTPAPGCSVSLASSHIRQSWRLTELLQGARPAPVTVNQRGGFASWSPLAELAPESVYVLDWRPL